MLCLLVLCLAACLRHAVGGHEQLCMCHIAETATIVLPWGEMGQFLSAQIPLCYQYFWGLINVRKRNKISNLPLFLNSHSFSDVSSCHCQNLLDFCLKINLDADLNSVSWRKISSPVLIGHGCPGSVKCLGSKHRARQGSRADSSFPKLPAWQSTQ